MIKKSLLAATVLIGSVTPFLSSEVQASTQSKLEPEKTVITNINEVNNFRKQMNIPTKDNGVIEIDRQFQTTQNNGISNYAVYSLVRKRTYETCGSNPVVRTSGTGTIKASVSDQFSASISGGFGVSFSKINSTFGTNITSSRTIKTSTSYTVPKGKTGTIEGYLSYQNIDFDQYVGGIKTGSGTVTYPIGVCWDKYYR